MNEYKYYEKQLDLLNQPTYIEKNDNLHIHLNEYQKQKLIDDQKLNNKKNSYKYKLFNKLEEPI